MDEHLYLHNLQVINDQNNMETCYVHIPIVNRECMRFEVIPCDKDGSNLNYDRAEDWTILKVSQNSNRITIKRKDIGDQFYKIVPVTITNKRIQCEENHDNIVEVKRIQRIVTYSFFPGETKRGFLGIGTKVEPARLSVVCAADVECGALGYKVNGVFIPLPAFKNSINIEGIPNQLKDIQLTTSSVEMSEKYRIQRN